MDEVPYQIARRGGTEPPALPWSPPQMPPCTWPPRASQPFHARQRGRVLHSPTRDLAVDHVHPPHSKATAPWQKPIRLARQWCPRRQAHLLAPRESPHWMGASLEEGMAGAVEFVLPSCATARHAARQRCAASRQHTARPSATEERS